MKIRITLILLSSLILMAGCAHSGRNEIALIHLDEGDVILRLFPKEAPNHVNRFKELARNKFYNGVLIHRILPDVLVQFGDPLTRDPMTPRSQYGSGGSGQVINPEISDLKHIRGTVGMVRSPNKSDNGSTYYGVADSQLYICIDDQPHLDEKYTIIGEVIEGMEIVDGWTKMERDMLEIPVQPVMIHRIEILTPSELKKMRKLAKKKAEITTIVPDSASSQ